MKTPDHPEDPTNQKNDNSGLRIVAAVCAFAVGYYAMESGSPMLLIPVAILAAYLIKKGI